MPGGYDHADLFGDDEQLVVELDAYALPDDHQVFKAFPGEGYKFYDVAHSESVVFLDIRFLEDLPPNPAAWDADARALAEHDLDVATAAGGVALVEALGDRLRRGRQCVDDGVRTADHHDVLSRAGALLRRAAAREISSPDARHSERRRHCRRNRCTGICRVRTARTADLRRAAAGFQPRRTDARGSE